MKPRYLGAERLLRHLHSKGVPIALATSSSRENYELKTQRHKHVFELFSHIVTGSSDAEVKRGKPAPDIFLICASRFPEPPQPERVKSYSFCLSFRGFFQESAIFFFKIQSVPGIWRRSKRRHCGSGCWDASCHGPGLPNGPTPNPRRYASAQIAGRFSAGIIRASSFLNNLLAFIFWSQVLQINFQCTLLPNILLLKLWGKT